MQNHFLHRIYLWGYGRRVMPRWLRRAIARSEIHRAWLSGRDGFFVNTVSSMDRPVLMA